ncbi:MAG: hypothetical protein K6B46_06400 [Opitutales bacterium]|nr:hypothetical protein [Opitutales bacterium]
MKNICKITNVFISENKVEVEFDVQGEWKKYFIGNKYWVEYSQNISAVPKDVAIVPFIANFAILASIVDGRFELGAIDEDFANCLKEVAGGFEKMYPMMKFSKDFFVTGTRFVKNLQPAGTKSATFFSGGVDAFNTLVNHADEHPDLLTVWGSDVKLTDFEGWKNVYSHVKETSEKFGTDAIVIKSNFRLCIDEGLCSSLVLSMNAKDAWWHGFHHALSLHGQAAPLAFLNNYKQVYFASTFCFRDLGKYTCASDPTTDNFVKFCGCKIIHDGFEFNRQDKVHNIVKFSREHKIKIAPRVCWISTGGKNCGVCEKCYRTIIEFVAEGADPNDFGFEWNKEDIQAFKKAVKYRLLIFPEFNYCYYEDAQILMKQSPEKFLEDYKWFLELDIKNFNHYPVKFIRKKFRDVYTFPRRALLKILRVLKLK